MVFKDEQEAIRYIKANETVSKRISDARTEHTELKALIDGEGFTALLLQIENVESKQKAKVRKTYSRNIVDFFSRLLRPVDNVYHSTGGSKVYDIEGEKREILLNTLADIRGGKSLEGWLETFWMQSYHNDPAGVVFVEYTSRFDEGVKPYPTYKSINHIRNYIPNGQRVEAILFEPKTVTNANGSFQVWRLVDDLTDWTFIEQGGNFTLDVDNSFEHPFGTVPCLINSDITALGTEKRQSPLNSIIAVTKEYARDQSIKTIYKFLHGFPIFWKLISQCNTCTGTGRVGDDVCPDCDGHGYYKRKDVTDEVTLPVPKEGEPKIAPDIAGYVVPPLDIWNQYTSELELLEDTSNFTHWGAVIDTQKKQTATEVVVDVQPVVKRLNIYGDVAEFMEQAITEWVANALDMSKEKGDSIASINYGRDYIIEPSGSILTRYEESKAKGDNNTILDRLFNEYLGAKYKNDMPQLHVMLLKSEVEPYLHLDYKQTLEIFGNVEAQKKALFEDWWKTLNPSDLKKTAEQLKVQFNAWFIALAPEDEETDSVTLENQAKLRGSVGGVTGIVSILQGVAFGQISKESAIGILTTIYGLSETDANKMVGDTPTVTPPQTGNIN